MSITLDPITVVTIAATFLLAGAVKGVIGLGLPTVSLGVLTVTLDLTTAMALLIVPSLVTNVWQAVVGGHFKAILAKIWPFLIAATLTIWFGAHALDLLSLGLLSALLGVLLIAYASLSLAGVRFTLASNRGAWVGLVLGTTNGVLTGMTGSFVVPGVMYLQALGLSRDALVQAMGMLFTVSTVGLAFALRSHEMLNADLGIVSSFAVVPALLGMLAGQQIRGAISEARFRQVFFISILALGVYIIATTLSGNP